MSADETFRCGSRDRDGGVLDRAFPGPDRWRIEANGDRCCSHCGSLCEADFIEIIEAYADGKPGYHFDPSTKGYKKYAHRPGVQNAGQGGIKFYAWHIDTTPGPDLDRKSAIFDRAMDRFVAEMRGR